jgi:glycosyltransferase involved in cell wall biosynthesis
MKILLAHNFYGSTAPSGENAVVLAEKKLLKERGHKITEYVRHSDEIRNQGVWGNIKGAFSTPWNPFSKKHLHEILQREKPDILHVHNFFPLLSPAVFYAVKNLKAATVFTLHNYRLFCPASILMRQGRPCTDCLNARSVFPSIVYGCYRESRIATLPLAAMIGLHRFLRTWEKHVDAFIALTEFQCEIMSKSGLPEEKFHVKPHFYADQPYPNAWNDRQEKIVFIGRLGEEKGASLLIKAWKKWGDDAPLLEIIGDGPEQPLLTNQIIANNLTGKIRLAGQLPFEETQSSLAASKLLILPSLCFEGFPMVIREAFALGTPVAASRLGAMKSLIIENKNGVLFDPGSSDDIYRTVKAYWFDQQKLSEMGAAARVEFEEKYTAETNYKMLMNIYQAAIKERQKHLKD